MNNRIYSTKVMKSRLHGSRVRDHVIVHSGLNVSSSAHNCGHMSNDGTLLQHFEYYIIIKRNAVTCNREYTKHCMRSRHQLKMADPAKVRKNALTFEQDNFRGNAFLYCHKSDALA